MGLGCKRGRKISALVRASRLALPCQQVDHQCVTAELNLYHLSVFDAAAQLADGGVMHAGLSLCLFYSAVGRFRGVLVHTVGMLSECQ